MLVTVLTLEGSAPVLVPPVEVARERMELAVVPPADGHAVLVVCLLPKTSPTGVVVGIRAPLAARHHAGLLQEPGLIGRLGVDWAFAFQSPFSTSTMRGM